MILVEFNTNMLSQILFLLFLLILSGIFSGTEVAMISVSKSKVDALVAKKVRNAKILQKLKKHPNKLLITVLIGNNIVNVGASAYAAVLLTNAFGSNGIGIATGLMTFLLLIFGEITPKSFCHSHAEKVSLWIAKPIYVLQILLTPFVWFFERIVKVVNYIMGGTNVYTVTEGEVLAMLKIGAKEGSIEKQEQELIENVFEFNDIEVEEVMTPRVAIEAMDAEMTVAQAVKFVIKHSHSRIPVYNENLDHIIGVLTIKDLLKYFNDKTGAHKKLGTLKLHTPLEVPHSKKINTLFSEFQRKHVMIAIVIDEFGGTAGIVTLEDLLEEIVGDIVDEDDVAETPIEVIDSNNLMVKGVTLMEDVNDFFRMKFWANDRDTVNSMVLDYLHRFPREGESIKFPLGNVVIKKMKRNVIEKAKITKSKRVKAE